MMPRSTSSYADLRRDPAGFEDLAPAVAEVPVADHETGAVARELPRDRFHAVRAATRYDHDGSGVVRRPERARNVAHDLLEPAGHVVERSLREDDRVLGKAIRVDGIDTVHRNLRSS
jgi:hypothetical protein